MLHKILSTLKGVIAKDIRKYGAPSSPRSLQLKRFVSALLGKSPMAIELYDAALTHRSYEGGGTRINNERLEFLGDSVISCVVGHCLYEKHTSDNEGSLTTLRSQIVSRSNLNKSALHLNLDSLLRYNGVNLSGSDVVGNALEAFVGAIYLDLGFDAAARFVRKHIVIDEKHLRRVQSKEEDYKTEFVILMQQHKIPFEFRYLDSYTEPNKGLVHRSEIVIGGDNPQVLSTGVGVSKKVSHQNAARDALALLKRQPKIIAAHSRRTSPAHP